MNDTVTVNGVTITPEMSVVLKSWEEKADQKLPPERYVEYLNDTQDFIARYLLLESDRNNECVDLLTKLITIKDDLKCFIPKNNSHE